MTDAIDTWSIIDTYFRDTPYYLEYSDSLIVDGYDTFDKFEDGKCLERPNLNETWKSK